MMISATSTRAAAWRGGVNGDGGRRNVPAASAISADTDMGGVFETGKGACRDAAKGRRIVVPLRAEAGTRRPWITPARITARPARIRPAPRRLRAEDGRTMWPRSKVPSARPPCPFGATGKNAAALARITFWRVRRRGKRDLPAIPRRKYDPDVARKNDNAARPTRARCLGNFGKIARATRERYTRNPPSRRRDDRSKNHAPPVPSSPDLPTHPLHITASATGNDGDILPSRPPTSHGWNTPRRSALLRDPSARPRLYSGQRKET